MRYAVSGSNTTAVSGGTGSATGILQYALGKKITTGRVFWLTGLFIPRGHGTNAYITLYDATAGATAQGKAAVLTLMPVTAGGVYDSGIRSFSPPGIKFSTAVAVRIGATVATGTCTLPIGGIAGCGYEE